MREKNVRRGIAFFVLFALSVWMFCPVVCVCAKGDGGGVVEESVIIGGEASPQVESRPVTQIVPELPVQEEKQVRRDEKERPKEHLQEEKYQEEKCPEETEQIPGVSANEATFVLPGSRGEERLNQEVLPRREHKNHETNKVTGNLQEHEITKASEVPQPNRVYTIAFFASGSICLILGMIRIVLRLRIGYGKL